MNANYLNPRNLAHRSDAVVWNGTVYLAGIMPRNAGADIADQTRDVLEQIDQQLVAAGTDRSWLLSANIWLSDVQRDVAAFNAIWSGWLAPARPPARTCLQGTFQIPGLLEVSVTAADPSFAAR